MLHHLVPSSSQKFLKFKIYSCSPKFLKFKIYSTVATAPEINNNAGQGSLLPEQPRTLDTLAQSLGLNQLSFTMLIYPLPKATRTLSSGDSRRLSMP